MTILKYSDLMLYVVLPTVTSTYSIKLLLVCLKWPVFHFVDQYVLKVVFCRNVIKQRQTYRDFNGFIIYLCLHKVIDKPLPLEQSSRIQAVFRKPILKKKNELCYLSF